MKIFIFLSFILPVLSGLEIDPVVSVEYPTGSQSIFTELGFFAHQTGYHHGRVKFSFKDIFNFLQQNLNFFIDLRRFYVLGESPNADIILSMSNDTEIIINGYIRQFEGIIQALPSYEFTGDQKVQKRFIGAFFGIAGMF